MDIWRLAQAEEDYVIRCRRWFHENAELSDHEDDTVAYILQELNAMGIACEDVPKGGVMGFIEGGKPGKTVLLRADIDALPIQEDPCNNKQPKVCVSKRDGAAHACGHDTHAAMLLGAAKILHTHRDEIAGRIVLYFERGEEHGHGDYYMVKHLQDNNIHVDGCYAQHIKCILPSGKIGLLKGGVYAGNTSWNITVYNNNGKALACGVALVNALNALRMRTINPHQTVTLSNNKFIYDEEAGTCLIGGTCRYHDIERSGKPMRDAIYETAKAVCTAFGCEAKIPRGGTSRGVVNHPVCYEIAKRSLLSVLGPEHIHSHPAAMGAESFAILGAYYPSYYGSVGAGNPEKGMDANNHNPKFEPDEAGLKYGVAAAAAFAVEFLAYDKPIDFQPFVGNIDEYLAAHR